MSLIPFTKGKLSSSVSIYVSVSPNLVSTFYENYGQPLFYNSEDKKSIGAVIKLGRTQPRNPERIYALGKHAFEPNRVVPTPIVTDLTFTRVVLYDSDMLEAIGFPHGNLFYQQNPFLLEEVQWAPIQVGHEDGTVTVDKEIVRSILYFDCWFSNSPITYDILNDNQLVIQEGTITCGKMRCSDADQVVEGSRTVELIGGAVQQVFKF